MTARRTGLAAAVLAAAAIAGAWLAMPGPAAPPAFDEVRRAHRPSDVALVDRHGEVLQELRVDLRHRRFAWTPLDLVSPALREAVVRSEDRRFYRHGGVDGRAVLGAVAARLTGGPRRGASTIPMQVAALLDPGLRRRGGPHGTKTLGQKWRQMRLAWALERRWTKAELLEAYLNLATFRGEVEGVGAAAGVLFGKAPHGLTEAEATVLAALLRGPNADAAVLARRALALEGLAGAPGAEREAARAEVAGAVLRATAAPAGAGPRAADAPHAAARLLRGSALAAPARTPVRSTLDGPLQRFATEALRRQLLAVRGQRVRDGAVLVVDNATGEVLAYVGGSGDLGSARHVDGAQARRQAGSALKPFLYGLALEERLLTPASLLEDTPLEVPTAGGLYRPRNYDERFEGLVSVRTALAASLNVPAVRTLQLVGTEPFVLRLRDLGFAGLTESGDFYGPALALGSADVSLWELVGAYRTLAEGGVAGPMTLEPAGPPPVRRRLYPEAVAFLVSDILARRESRSATFGLENALATRFWTAVKTGTSKDMRDNWCVGYSRRYTVGAWVGNFSGEPMHDVSGVTGAAPVWREVMTWLHRDAEGAPSPGPAPPPGVVAATVAFPGGIEPSRREWLLAGTEPAPAASGARPAAPAVLAWEAARPPRILAPVSGTVVALDPDIPPGRQRMVFEAEAATPALRLVLDGADLGPASAPVVWAPAPGRHALALVDGGARTLDAVTFEVR